jgi:hypothetical protein
LVSRIIIWVSNFERLIAPKGDFLSEDLGEGGSSFVQLGPPVQLGSNGIPLEEFLPRLRFEHKSKLDQLGIEISSLDIELGK